MVKSYRDFTNFKFVEKNHINLGVSSLRCKGVDRGFLSKDTFLNSDCMPVLPTLSNKVYKLFLVIPQSFTGLSYRGQGVGNQGLFWL